MKLYAGLLVVFAISCVKAEETDEDSSAQSKFLVGLVRTKVVNTVSTSTVAIPVICSSTMGTATCTGRKKRKRSIVPSMSDDKEHSSLDSSVNSNPSDDLSTTKDSKLVIWTTTTSTVVFTSYSVLTGTTLQVSYGCSIAGISLAPAC